MKSYKIKYWGHEAIAKGEDARDAFDNYCNRLFFGYQPIVAFNTQLKLIDADTRGEKWAVYYNDNLGTINVDLI